MSGSLSIFDIEKALVKSESDLIVFADDYATIQPEQEIKTLERAAGHG